jgi:SET domain-containing protein
MFSNSKVYIDSSPIHGKGLFARTFIPSGTVIANVRGEPALEDSHHVLWVNGNKGWLVKCELRYINHSERPNAVFYDTLEVCALRDIWPGEEITHNYSTGENV